jgi:hypothetical protein
MGETMMTDIRNRRARSVVSAGFGVMAGAAAFSWGWNRIAADLGGFPEADFVHGLAALVATAAIAGIAAFVARLVSGWARG